jgi:hypothetical protein
VRLFHINLDVLDGAELIVGFLKFEGLDELVMPVCIWRKRKAWLHLARRIKAQQLLGDLPNGRFDAALGAFPGPTTELAERGGRAAIASPEIFLHEVQGVDRHVDLIMVGEL